MKNLLVRTTDGKAERLLNLAQRLEVKPDELLALLIESLLSKYDDEELASLIN
jgi:hypothetical protein